MTGTEAADMENDMGVRKGISAPNHEATQALEKGRTMSNKTANTVNLLILGGFSVVGETIAIVDPYLCCIVDTVVQVLCIYK